MTKHINIDEPDIKLVRALQEDFEELYVKEFTAEWRESRIIRNIELGVMRLENLEALINKQIIEARIDELAKLQTFTKRNHLYDQDSAMKLSYHVKHRLQALKGDTE